MATFDETFGSPTPLATAPTPAANGANGAASNGHANGNNKGVNGAGVDGAVPNNGTAANKHAHFPPPAAAAAAAAATNGAKLSRQNSSLFGKKTPRKQIVELSPAEVKALHAKEIGMEPPLNLSEVWDVERGVTEMDEWPQKLSGYRELLFYLFFYIIYCIIQIMQADPYSSYAVNNALGTVVSGYDGVTDLDSWWDFTGGVLDTIFTPTWYNGDRFSTEENGFVLSYNKLIGGVLLHQTRGSTVDCAPSLYGVFYGSCHGDVPATGNFTTESTSAKTTYTYDEEQQGYTKFFSVALTQDQVDAQLAQLKQSRWLDKNTRVVTIKFAVYNGEYGVFTFASVVMTYGIGGVMFGNNKATIQSAKFEIYRTQDDWARLALEIIFMYMAAWLFSDEMIDLVNTIAKPSKDANGEKSRSLIRGVKIYFSSMWNYLDLINHGLCFTYIGQRINYVIYIFHNPIELPTNKYQQELEVVAELQTALLLIISLNIFVKILHLFKYFAFQPRMNILSQTVGRALPDLFHFFILFGCVFLAYCVMGMLLFGPHLPTYSSFGLISETMGEYMVGQFDYSVGPPNGTHDINPLMATLVFWSFVLLVVFVLVNVFLAILIDAYAVAKSEASNATGIPQDIGRIVIQTFSRKPKGATGDPLREALKFFKSRGITKIETADIEWYLLHQYEIVDPKFLLKNEGLLRAMQCRVEKDTPNCEMEALLQAAWAKYDADGSGFLDRDEFAAFLKDAPIKTRPGDEARIDQMLRDADVNGDGVVSFDEFVPVFHAVILSGLAQSARVELAEQKPDVMSPA